MLLCGLLFLAVINISSKTKTEELVFAIDGKNTEIINLQNALESINQEKEYTQNKNELFIMEADALSYEIESLGNTIEELEADIQIKQNKIDNLLSLPSVEDNFEKIAYLTFDDGPSYNTLRVLKILDRYKIKATFFVVYTEYGDKNDIYNQILEQGHTIGNHTYNHTKAFGNWDNFWDDLYRMEDFLLNETGEQTKLIRFPGGTSQNWYGDEECLAQVQQLRQIGYQYFDWNVSTSDGGSNVVSKDEILSFVKGRSKYHDKIIVLMHDRGDKESTVEALPDVIEYLRNKGYVFLPLTTNSYTRQFFDINKEEMFS